MVNTNKIRMLLQIQDLCDTVDQCAAYLAEHPDNGQIRSDLLAGLRALENHLSALESFSGEAASAWMGMARLLSDAGDCTRLTAASRLLFGAVSHAINQALTRELEGRIQLERDLAEKLFAYFQKIPHDDLSSYQLMALVLLGSGFSAPEETFHGWMRLFEEMPDLFSGDKQRHPGYVYRPSAQRTIETCPVCGKAGTPYYCAFSYLLSNFSHPFLPAKLWMKCGTCGNLYTWKFPEEKLALSDQSGLVLPKGERWLYKSKPASGDTVFSIWSNILNKARALSQGSSLLEVGIGKGELLAVALEMGYEVDAVEIVPDAAQEVANLLHIPIWNGDFLKYDTDKTYSIITMGDVIEHVTDPEGALRRAYRLLDDNGVLWLSTPNFESAFSRFYKFDDPMWCEPYHISYFSRRGFEALANRCGFEIREYNVSNRYNGSMEIFLTKRR